MSTAVVMAATVRRRIEAALARVDELERWLRNEVDAGDEAVARHWAEAREACDSLRAARDLSAGIR